MKNLYYRDGLFVDDFGNLYSIYDAIYLEENGKAILFKDNEIINKEYFMKNKEIFLGYMVFKDLKNKGLRFGSGLKFGGYFRVYKHVLDEHSKWVCFPLLYDEKISIHDFIAKNRVAHSTRKTLMLAIVKDNKIVYIESKWKKL